MLYAYVYTDPRDGLPFYVGKGQKYRARKHLHQATNKGMAARLAELRALQLEPEIAVYTCDSEAHAFELERVLIDAYGRICEGRGTLVNILEAGERTGGFAGRKHSEESKAKIRAAMQARIMTVEHKQKIREKARFRTLSPLARQRAAAWSQSPEGRAVRSESAKRSLTPEHHRKMIEAARLVTKGRPRSEWGPR